MPGKNGTGPLGNGPLTGRGLGPCNGTNRGQYYGCGRGFGRGFGRGLGRGMGFGYNSTYGYNRSIEAHEMTQEEQKDMLNIEKEYLENELNLVNKHLENM